MKATFPHPKRSLNELEKEVAETIENGLILQPDFPAAQIAAWAFQELPAETRNEYSVFLLMERLTGLARAARRKTAKPQQPKLPGFEELPQRIDISKGRKKRLLDATYRDMREYVVTLNRLHKNHPKLKEATKLRDRLKARKQRGMTVAELLRVPLA